MKKLRIPLLLCVFLLALLPLTACGGGEEEGGHSAVIGPAASPEKDAQKEAVRTAVTQALSGAFDGELSVSVRPDRVEVSVLLSDPAYSADAEAPADWASVKAAAAEITLSLSDALKDLGDYRALIYLMDQQESILLTAFNGRAAFDKFERRAAQGDGTGLTQDAFDAVMEGMSYEEVCGLLGGEGELLSDIEDGEVHTGIYSWSDGSGVSVTVVFENGGMASKTQTGLEPSFGGSAGPADSPSGGMMVFPGGISVGVESDVAVAVVG